MEEQSINNTLTWSGYLGNVASILGIIAFGMDYIPRIITASSSTLEFKPIGILILLIFISSFSFYLIAKGRKNIKNDTSFNILNFLWFPYASLSISIYMVSAYLYIFQKGQINSSSWEILIIFTTTVATTYLILNRIKNIKFFLYYSYFFLVGLFFVALTFLYSYFSDKNAELDFIPLSGYMIIGFLLFMWFSHKDTKREVTVSQDNESSKKRKPYGLRK